MGSEIKNNKLHSATDTSGAVNPPPINLSQSSELSDKAKAELHEQQRKLAENISAMFSNRTIADTEQERAITQEITRLVYSSSFHLDKSIDRLNEMRAKPNAYSLGKKMLEAYEEAPSGKKQYFAKFLISAAINRDPWFLAAFMHCDDKLGKALRLAMKEAASIIKQENLLEKAEQICVDDKNTYADNYSSHRIPSFFKIARSLGYTNKEAFDINMRIIKTRLEKDKERISESLRDPDLFRERLKEDRQNYNHNLNSMLILMNMRPSYVKPRDVNLMFRLISEVDRSIDLSYMRFSALNEKQSSLIRERILNDRYLPDQVITNQLLSLCSLNPRLIKKEELINQIEQALDRNNGFVVNSQRDLTLANFYNENFPDRAAEYFSKKLENPDYEDKTALFMAVRYLPESKSQTLVDAVKAEIKSGKTPWLLFFTTLTASTNKQDNRKLLEDIFSDPEINLDKSMRNFDEIEVYLEQYFAKGFSFFAEYAFLGNIVGPNFEMALLTALNKSSGKRSQLIDDINNYQFTGLSKWLKRLSFGEGI